MTALSTYIESVTSSPIQLEERRNRQDIIEVFKMYRGYNSVGYQSTRHRVISSLVLSLVCLSAEL